MFAEFQRIVDNSVAYVEDLLGAQPRPLESECAFTAWFKKVVDATWIQNPQNVYNLVAIVLAFIVISLGIHNGWKQFQSIQTRRAHSTAVPASPTKPATRAAAAALKPAPIPVPTAAEPVVATRSSARRAASKKGDASSRSRSASVKASKAKRSKK
jgi:hypothetical protein